VDIPIIEVLPVENASLKASPASPRAAKLALVTDVCTKMERMRICNDDCLKMKGLSVTIKCSACGRQLCAPSPKKQFNCVSAQHKISIHVNLQDSPIAFLWNPSSKILLRNQQKVFRKQNSAQGGTQGLGCSAVPI
jgi:hypothetical protein